MGTKVQIDNYLPGHCSMRDLSRESNGANWSSCYGDNNLPNRQIYYGFLPRTIADLHPGYDKDVLKQTMLEHEAIFKNQVCELHRLYQVQRDLIDEVRRKEQFKHRIPYEASSSSSPVPPRMQSEDMQRWNGPSPFHISCPDTVQSYLHSTKGKSTQAEPSPSPSQSQFQNCYIPKNSEVSESRPTKFRRMLDLQLPAEEYIHTDEVEQFLDAKMSDNITPSPDKNENFSSGNRKLFLNNHGKVLVDLNEPIHVKETTGVSSVDFLGAGVCHKDVQITDLSTKFLSSSKDVLQNSRHGSLNGNLNNLLFQNRSNGQEWYCYGLEAEQHKGSVRSMNKGTPQIPSQPVQNLLDQAGQPPEFLTCDRYKGDPRRAKSVVNLEKSDRRYSLPRYKIPEPIPFHPSDLGKTRDQCASTWAKPSGGLSQKLSVQTSPFLSSQSAAQSNELFGNKWNLNRSPGSNEAFGSEPSMRNGFRQGSSPSSKQLPGFDNVNCNYSDNKTVPCFSNSYFKAVTCTDTSPVKNMNLNVPFPNGVSNDHITHPEYDHKSEDPVAVLPWLRGKVLSRGPSFALNSYDGDVKATSSRKILGVPIIEKSPNSPLANHHRSEKEKVESSPRKGLFDMNLPCEPTDSELDNMAVEEVVVSEKKMQNESASLRNHFDLNSCITEEESPCGTGIDLEAPIMLESEDDDPSTKEPEKQLELPQEVAGDGEAELATLAAEVIVAISSFELATSAPVEAFEEETMLHWFVDIACSSGNDLETRLVLEERGKNGKDGNFIREELDEFESMTLRLKECNVEEYFPKPSIPEFPSIKENGPRVLTTRTRKGQGRRGRQRRDFQRDILPGLASLSRHEVTEDLQTFGGLMRATGHPWNSGTNRRNATKNGCGRGRRRSLALTPAPVNTVLSTPVVIPDSNTEAVLEGRSLTGWGKTTRRPRRQRCPAGNPPPPLPLSYFYSLLRGFDS